MQLCWLESWLSYKSKIMEELLASMGIASVRAASVTAWLYECWSGRGLPTSGVSAASTCCEMEVEKERYRGADSGPWNHEYCGLHSHQRVAVCTRICKKIEFELPSGRSQRSIMSWLAQPVEDVAVSQSRGHVG